MLGPVHAGRLVRSGSSDAPFSDASLPASAQVLPLHETVETFIAGVIFAVATNFILLGSTKLVTVLVTYADLLLGFPFRLIGGTGWRALEEKATPVKAEELKGGLWALFDKPPPRVAPPLEKVWKENSADAAGVAALVSFGAGL